MLLPKWFYGAPFKSTAKGLFVPLCGFSSPFKGRDKPSGLIQKVLDLAPRILYNYYIRLRDNLPYIGK